MFILLNNFIHKTKSKTDNIQMPVYQYKFKQKDNFVIVDNFKEIDVSSTLIRDKISKKEYKNLEEYLDKNIIDYIIENKLYEGV